MNLAPALLLALQTPALDQAELAAKIDAMRAAFRTPGVAVALVSPEGASFVHASGIRSLARDPVTADTLFAIGSHTKTFTTTLYSLLVEERELAWNDPVIDHYAEFKLMDEAATTFCTVRDLACHRTGVGRQTSLWWNRTLSREDLVAGLETAKPSAPFGRSGSTTTSSSRPWDS